MGSIQAVDLRSRTRSRLDLLARHRVTGCNVPEQACYRIVLIICYRSCGPCLPAVLEVLRAKDLIAVSSEPPTSATSDGASRGRYRRCLEAGKLARTEPQVKVKIKVCSR